MKRLFAPTDAELAPWQRFISGGMAGVAAHSSVFPLEGTRIKEYKINPALMYIQSSKLAWLPHPKELTRVLATHLK